MKKAEAETAIRSLCHTWRHGPARELKDDQLSHTQFMDWMRGAGYGGYFGFRTTTSVSDDVERWFNDVLHQGWRE